MEGRLDMKRLMFAFALTPLLLVTNADARSRCKYFTDGREPLCLTTSDTGKEQFKDDRKSGSSFNDPRRRLMRQRMARAARFQEGAKHTQDMRTGGTPSSVGVISPFVPGSDQDRGWQLERKRRGLCGTDQRCLNAK